MKYKHLTFVFAFALLGGSARASSFQYVLDCVLNPPSGGPCQPGASFGTVRIEDVGLNQVSVSVDLLNPNLKFRDLMVNFNGTGFTDITSSVGENLQIIANGFGINPYGGAFDVGVVG